MVIIGSGGGNKSSKLGVIKVLVGGGTRRNDICVSRSAVVGSMGLVRVWGQHGINIYYV